MSAAPPGLQVAVDRRPDLTHPDELTSILGAPGFGQRFTDHMLLAEWTPERGWHDARIAAVITPLGRVAWSGGDIDCSVDGEAGPVTSAVRQALVDLQYGRAEDPF